MKFNFLFALFTILFLSIASVSALEFDNVKSYDNQTKIVTIRNSFGLGKVIGQAKLNTPLNVTVPRGYQKVAEFDLWAFQDYEGVLKQFQFKDMNAKKKSISRTYDLKYKTLENFEVNDYSTICEKIISEDLFSKTNSSNCKTIKTGSHIETREIWNDFKTSSFRKNQILTIGVFTNVQKDDYVDWIPTLYGVEVPEWATWEESLETNLEAYYNLDETSGTIADSFGNNDATNYGASSTTGKISNAYSFDGTNDYMNTSLNFPSDAWSVSFWSYQTSQADWHAALTSGGLNLWLGFGSTGKIRVHTGLNAYRDYNSALSLNEWEHVVVTWDGSSTLKLYVDGIEETSDGGAGALIDIPSQILQIGKRQDNSYPNYFNGKLDELGIWSRALSSSEVTDLYNSGSGITYSSCTPSFVNSSWSTWADNSSCRINDTIIQSRFRTQSDQNACGDPNIVYIQYQEVSCDYCSYSPSNSSWSTWADNSSCRINDTIIQSRYLTEYDSNYMTCYDVTGLASDLWNGGNNKTYITYQQDTCNYCSYNPSNSSWSSWGNLTGECFENNTVVEVRSLIEYDSNYMTCYDVTGLVSDLWTNNTYYDYQEGSCTWEPCINDVINTTWSSWINLGSCQPTNLTNQSRSLVQYDVNFCGNYTNVTFYEYQTSECVYSELEEGLIVMDFSKRINQILLVCAFIFSAVLFLLRFYNASGGILFLSGVIMTFSGLNPLFSLVVLGTGLGVLFKD